MVDVIAGLLVIFASVLLNIDFFVSYFHNNPQLAENISSFFLPYGFMSFWEHCCLLWY